MLLLKMLLLRFFISLRRICTKEGVELYYLLCMPELSEDLTFFYRNYKLKWFSGSKNSLFSTLLTETSFTVAPKRIPVQPKPTPPPPTAQVSYEISAAERKVLAKHFYDIDKDNSGGVTFFELRDYMAKNGNNFSENEIREMVDHG